MSAIQFLRQLYRTIFSIEEIESSEVLKWMCGVSLLFFYATFTRWIYGDETTIESIGRGTAYCWPYFQHCTKLYFLHSLPYSYSQMVFYIALFSIMCAIVFCMWKRLWTISHLLLTLLFLWKTFVVFVLAYNISGNYDYYHLFLTFLLLFVPYKEYFLKLSFVILYFLSVTTKFHQTWILGSYFTMLKTGTPIFPDFIAPLLTNSVIFMQIVGSWFLISSNRLYQRLSLTYFTIFHLYSGIFVHYLYPSIALTALLVLFGPLYRYTPPPTNWKRALPGVLFILAQFAFQLPAHFIVGDEKQTLEGNKYGMYMFEANHQCIAHVRYVEKRSGASIVDERTALAPGSPCSDGACITKRHLFTEGTYLVREETWESALSRNRCDPYSYFTRVKQFCDTANAVRVGLTFDHSIDGGPFYRIVDEQDICGLAYRPFGHNTWIRIPPEAQIVGYPLQNIIH